MEKSDEYIDYKEYIGYLRRVTGTPADPEGLRRNILAKSEDNVRNASGSNFLRWFLVILSVILFFAICLAVNS